jgi:hypothetical protein
MQQGRRTFPLLPRAATQNDEQIRVQPGEIRVQPGGAGELDEKLSLAALCSCMHEKILCKYTCFRGCTVTSELLE